MTISKPKRYSEKLLEDVAFLKRKMTKLLFLLDDKEEVNELLNAITVIENAAMDLSQKIADKYSGGKQ